MEEEYSITKAAELVGEKTHVLRHWEDILHLPIQRNHLGHRYYQQMDLDVLLFIKQKKEKGFLLKEIEGDVLSMYGTCDRKPVTVERAPARVDDESKRLMQFQTVISKAVAVALLDNKDIIRASLVEDISSEVSKQTTKELMKEMDYRLKEQYDLSEEHFRSIDERLRMMAGVKKEAVQKKAPEQTKKKKHFFFGKKKG